MKHYLLFRYPQTWCWRHCRSDWSWCILEPIIQIIPQLGRKWAASSLAWTSSHSLHSSLFFQKCMVFSHFSDFLQRIWMNFFLFVTKIHQFMEFMNIQIKQWMVAFSALLAGRLLFTVVKFLLLFYILLFFCIQSTDKKLKATQSRDYSHFRNGRPLFSVLFKLNTFLSIVLYFFCIFLYFLVFPILLCFFNFMEFFSFMDCVDPINIFNSSIFYLS